MTYQEGLFVLLSLPEYQEDEKYILFWLQIDIKEIFC